MKVLVDHGLGAQPLSPALAAVVAALPGDGTREALIGWSVAATVVLFLVGWALGVAAAYANIGFGQRMVYDLATDLFSHLQRLSLASTAGSRSATPSAASPPTAAACR